MKVCMISPNVLPVPAVKGGACETLVETLVKQNEINKEIDLICVSIFDEKAIEKSKEYKNTQFIFIEDEISNISILTFEEKDNKFYNYMDKVYEKIKDLEIDLLVIEGGDLEEYQYLLKRFPKQKCVAHFHGNFFRDDVYDKTYGYFISVSEFVSNQFLKGDWLDRNRMKVVYNGIEIEKFFRKLNDEEKKELRKNYNIKENENVILFCGRTVKNKGIKELILSFKKIKNFENSKLMIVGNSIFGNLVETEFDKELVRISEDIKDKIVFTNFIHNDDLYKIHNIADIAVVPTITEEAFGMVVVEYLASGLPLIVTNSGGIPEIVNEKCAIVIEKDNSMIEMLTKSIDFMIENPDKRKEMSENGKKVAENFSGEKFYRNMINALQYFYEKNNSK